ncbi:MAG: thioester reductase domain-containing protein [Exilibacterium sp.]
MQRDHTFAVLTDDLLQREYRRQEVERLLSAHAWVVDLVTFYHRKRPNNLIACVACNDTQLQMTELASQLRRHLRQQTWLYPLPTAIHLVEAFPMSATDNVDIEALYSIVGDIDGDAPFIPAATATEQRLAMIWAELLECEAEEISADDNFFMLGGYSLLMPRLNYEVEKYFDCELTLPVIFENPKLRDMAAAIEQCMMGEQASLTMANEIVNLDMEAELARFSFDLQGVAEPVLPPSHILLTGATGFIGSFLLVKLLQWTQAKITCLVRGKNAALARERLIETLHGYQLLAQTDLSRVVVVAGDLIFDNLGMEPAHYTELAESVHAVYHCAASVNHFATYEQLKPANVQGTLRLLQLCTTAIIKPFNFISTIGVLKTEADSDTQTLTEDSDINAMIHLPSEGYNASKWVTEKILIKARSLGLPTKIFRVGLVCGARQSGVIAESLWIFYYLKSCVSIGCYLDLFDTTYIDPVDVTAESIVRLGQFNGQSNGQGQDDDSWIHHVFSVGSMSLSELFTIYNQTAEYQQIRVPVSLWLQEAEKYQKKHGVELPFVSYLAGITMNRVAGEADQTDELIIKSDKTLTRLANVGMEWPRFDDGTVKKSIEWVLHHKSTILMDDEVLDI